MIGALSSYIILRETGSYTPQATHTEKITSISTEIKTYTQTLTQFSTTSIIVIVKETKTYTYTTYSGESPQKITVVDALNRTLVFDRYPERIVFVGKGARYMLDLFYVFKSAPKKIIAFDTMFKTSPVLQLLEPELDKKAIFTGTPNVETLISLKPDLVIMKSAFKKDGDTYESAGLRVMYVDPETPEGFFRDLMNIGVVMGERDRAAEVASYIKMILTYLHDKLANISETRPRVLFLYYSVKGDTASIKVPPSSYLQNYLIELAGGDSVSKNIPGGQWVEINLEQVLAWNPSIIFVVTYSTNPSPTDVIQRLISDPSWSNIDAIKNKRIYPVPGLEYSWDMPGPKWPLFIVYAASKIYPELFRDFSLKQFLVDYYSRIYDIDLGSAEKIALYDLRGMS